jgi:hypothetical protein
MLDQIEMAVQKRLQQGQLPWRCGPSTRLRRDLLTAPNALLDERSDYLSLTIKSQ